jgi:hypothetical protein
MNISSPQNTISQSAIDQYKTYFKNLNPEQSNLSTLLNTFNSSVGVDSLFGDNNKKDNSLEDFFAQEASTRVQINRDAVQKKLWTELENEVKYYEAHNPDAAGKYIVAINPAGPDGLPQVQVAGKADVLKMVAEADQQASDDFITQHPVQVFTKTSIDVAKLTPADIPGLEQVVAEFMGKNQGVFQFLNSQPAAPDTSSTDASGDSLATYMA